MLLLSPDDCRLIIDAAGEGWSSEYDLLDDIEADERVDAFFDGGSPLLYDIPMRVSWQSTTEVVEDYRSR